MLLDYLERLYALRDISEVWAMHGDVMRKFGFDRLIYGSTNFRPSVSLDDQRDILILSNHDPEYIRAFVEGGMFRNAPMTRWALENCGACSWSWLRDNYENLTAAEQEVLEFNRKMGVTAGYTISFKNISVRTTAVIALTAPRGVQQHEINAMWAEHGRVIVQMNNAMHLRLTNMPYPAERQELTDRQREVLEWVGEGKTVQDIAAIMGLTAPTIEKHLRLARQALDVETTAQAVLRASFRNQIYRV